MSRLIDLTVPWGPEVQPLEGHPRITFSPVTTHAVEGRSNTRVVFSIHTGSHIDAPYHFFPEGKTIDRMPLEIFMGAARLVDLTRFAAPRHAITREELLATGITAADCRGKRVVLRTDWATHHWRQPDLYTANPYLSEDAAAWLGETGLVALGLDFAVDAAYPYPNHYVFLGREVVLMENLVNLDQIPVPEFTLVAFPLRVVGGDGGPVRAVAVLPDGEA
jgi:arylformamidase